MVFYKHSVLLATELYQSIQKTTFQNNILNGTTSDRDVIKNNA